MNWNHYLAGLSTKETPQSEAILGSDQVPNNAGGFAWEVTDWVSLDRFLILGTEGGTYYVKEQKLTKDSAEAVLRCIKEDGIRVVNRVVEISEAGRAPKNDPAIFVLALASVFGDEKTRQLAYQSLSRVCRIGTHLFHFIQFREQLGGWSAGLRRAVSRWYDGKPVDQVVYQILKYAQRDSWSHRDLLRLAHPKTTDELRNSVYKYIVDGWESVGDEPHPDAVLSRIWASEKLKTASAQEAIALIRQYRLPREVVPTPLLKEASVWEVLLEDMPMTALIRNLATLTRVGLLSDGSDATKKVVAQLGDEKRLRSARVHPISVLSALLTYQAGKGNRGSGTWTPVRQVVDALDAAFYSSFGNVEPSGKRLLLALDVSGSMSWSDIGGVPGLTPRVASAAMAMITAATEPDYQIMAFATQFVPLDISPRQRLDDVCKKIDKLDMGGTDCALPMTWALENKKEIDCFVVFTDSETWFGKIHPAQALKKYRTGLNIPAKSVVVGMVANKFTIADPKDKSMLDVVGFDTATPNIISNFAQGL